MIRALRVYVAEVTVLGLDLLCALTAHVGGCWCSTGGPLRRLYVWAFDVVHPEPQP